MHLAWACGRTTSTCPATTVPDRRARRRDQGGASPRGLHDAAMGVGADRAVRIRGIDDGRPARAARQAMPTSAGPRATRPGDPRALERSRDRRRRPPDGHADARGAPRVTGVSDDDHPRKSRRGSQRRRHRARPVSSAAHPRGRARAGGTSSCAVRTARTASRRRLATTSRHRSASRAGHGPPPADLVDPRRDECTWPTFVGAEPPQEHADAAAEPRPHASRRGGTRSPARDARCGARLVGAMLVIVVVAVGFVAPAARAS